MSKQTSDTKEPLNLKVILPLLAILVVLFGIVAIINLSRSPYVPMTTLELNSSFANYVSKFDEKDHYKLYVSLKKVALMPGPTLSNFLQGLEGAELISSVDLTYEIPIFINLVEDWVFLLKENEFQSQVPFPVFGEPLFEPSRLVLNFKSDLSEEKKSDLSHALKDRLSVYKVPVDPASQASLENESRLKVQEFIDTWLHSKFKNLPKFNYKISFTGSKNLDSFEEL